MFSQSTCTEPAGRVLLVALLTGVFTPDLAAGIDLEKILMPGEVIRGHADLEAECSNCHQPFKRTEQRSLCLDCHDVVAVDVVGKTGFHGRSNAVAMECKICHTEHIGRDGDIVGLDPDTFDHDFTDFGLVGRHQSVACTECHPSEDLHRDAMSDCVDCHGEEDPHDGNLGNECQDCHNPKAWTRIGFDHDETRFRLVGRHAQVACSFCHPSEQFEETPMDCYSCHRLNDAHSGRFGRKCEDCHSSRAWAVMSFDHDRDTDFPLVGSHQRVECESCHTTNPYEVELQTGCYSCHRTDDKHKGRFGRSCDSCHSPNGWDRLRFDHDATDFPLRGLHEQVACARCHTRTIGESKLGTDCQACHLQDDVHKGQQGEECAQCHQETGWSASVFFDHDLTQFPLLGLHAAATCEDCHATTAFHDAPTGCDDCHRDDDFHERTLGPGCQVCHNPNGWNFWQFDHRQTDFLLEGAHVEQTCRDCHAKPVARNVQTSTTCGYCHQRDDVHLGRYGRECSRCHHPDGWDRVRSDR